MLRKASAIPYKLNFGKEIKTTIRGSREELLHVNEQTPDQIKEGISRFGFDTRVFTQMYGGGRPSSASDMIGEFLINFGPAGGIPGIKMYLNRYIWAIATKPEK